MVKIVFEVEDGTATESLWAERLPGGQFKIQNSPFYVRGISYCDIVAAVPSGDMHEFSAVVKRSGHSTYQLMLSETLTSEDFERAWRPLQELGCTYEEGPGTLVAVDVPKEADIHAVYALLAAGRAAELWDLQEGHCGHAVA